MSWFHIRRLAPLFLTLCAAAQDLAEFEKKVSEFTLPNGLHFIILQRPQAPVVSMVTYVNVGSANDPAGKTGLAHMFEHMAFKGTDSLGTKNWLEEKKTLAGIEQIYDRLEAERNKGPRAAKDVVTKLEAELKAAIDKANGFVEKEAYSTLIQENGGVGMNAGTSVDYTMYFYSLPSNRLELWFLLTSQVFRQPVMREFYKERDVVREERRMRIESSAQGKMQETLQMTAFLAHPQRTLIGHSSDIENLRAKDSETFFRQYYVPSNMVMVIAGDVNPKEARRLADTYFGAMQAGTTPPRVTTDEPKQEGERRVAIETPSQPLVFFGYKRPSSLHPDDAALRVLAGALSSGRTGVLYKELVEQKKIAAFAGASPNFTSQKYPGMFMFFAAPAVGKSLEENEKGILDIIAKVRKENIEAAVLERVKNQVRGGLVRALDSNFGMAMQLASNYMLHGDWRRMFTGIQDIEKVTAEDVRRVAQAYLVDSQKTLVYTKAPAKEEKQ